MKNTYRIVVAIMIIAVTIVVPCAVYGEGGNIASTNFTVTKLSEDAIAERGEVQKVNGDQHSIERIESIGEKAISDIEPMQIDDSSETIVLKSDLEADIELRNQIDAEVARIIQNNSGVTLHSSSAHGGSQWKTEYAPKKTVAIGGYAGNQPTGGVNFGKEGGGFYYSTTGGPAISATVAFATPFGSVGVSLKAGTRSTGVTGYYKNVPGSTTAYYKLYVTKNAEVQPYIVYNKVNGVWKVYSRECVVVEKSLALSVVRVS